MTSIPMPRLKHPDRLFIGGEWVEPHSGRQLEIVSPDTEQVAARVAEADEVDMDRAVAAARDAFDNGPWRWIAPGERIIPDDALDRYKELKTAVERNPRWQDRLLPDCMLAALHRFHATNSIQDAATAVKDRAELAADQLDSSLSLVRYIAWAIPAIGFIGTVRGIGLALAFAEDAIKGDIAPVTAALGLAFNSTLVALIISMGLMYFMHVVQSRQEAFVLETQTYCRDKLIDVMKVPAREENTSSFV